MRLSRAQAIVIVSLNILIAALLAFIFLLPVWKNSGAGADPNDPTGGGDEPTGTQPTEPVHNKLRDPIQGKTEEVLRETRLMGTGDETVTAVYFRDGVTYIIGNATVGDYDFDSYGGFVCAVGSDGKILGFSYFSGTVTACGVLGDGIAVATRSGSGSESTFALHTVNGLEIKKSTDVESEVQGIYAVEPNKAAVVTQPDGSSLKLTEYSTVADAWTVGRSTRIDSGYTLKFFDCYDFGGGSYVIAARAHSLPMYDAIVFYSFAAGGDAAEHYYGGGSGNITRPYAVMPSEFGYFALCDKGGFATIISLDYSFMSYHSLSLGFAFDDARLFYSGGKYYACFDCAEGAVTYRLGKDLSREKLSRLDGVIADCVVPANGDAIVAGHAPTNVPSGTKEYNKLTLVNPAVTEHIELSVKNAVVYGGYTDGDTVVIVLSATGGDALSAPTGGRDIYVVAIRS